MWRDNSNIDFKWNISKIMTLTLIAKVSFIVLKSLSFLHFLQNRKNFNYSHNTAHKHFRCIFDILNSTTLLIWTFLCLFLLDFLLIWSFCTHIFIHKFIIFIRVRYTYHFSFISLCLIAPSPLAFFLPSYFFPSLLSLTLSHPFIHLSSHLPYFPHNIWFFLYSVEVASVPLAA